MTNYIDLKSKLQFILTNLHRHFQAQLSFHSPAQPIVLLLGRSGAGKSSIFNILNNYKHTLLQQQLVFQKGLQVANVSASESSCTLRPNISKNSDYFLCDSAGLLNNFNFWQRLDCIGYLCSMIKRAGTIKLVIVIAETDLIDSRLENLQILIEMITAFAKAQSRGQLISNFSKYGAVVVNKVSDKERLIKRWSYIVERIKSKYGIQLPSFPLIFQQNQQKISEFQEEFQSVVQGLQDSKMFLQAQYNFDEKTGIEFSQMLQVCHTFVKITFSRCRHQLLQNQLKLLREQLLKLGNCKIYEGLSQLLFFVPHSQLIQQTYDSLQQLSLKCGHIQLARSLPSFEPLLKSLEMKVVKSGISGLLLKARRFARSNKLFLIIMLLFLNRRLQILRKNQIWNIFDLIFHNHLTDL